MKNNKVIMIVIIVLLVILLGVIAGMFWIGYGFVKGDGNGGAAPQETIVALKPEDIETVKLSAPISVNLLPSDDGKQHYAKVDIGIGVDTTDEKKSAAFVTLLTEKDVITRDICIDVLSSKTYEELQDPNSRALLKQDILERLQKEFDTNLIVEIYLSDFYYT